MRCRAIGAVAVVVLPACEDPASGAEVCTRSVRVLPDAASAGDLGIVAAEVLAGIAGEHGGRLSWLGDTRYPYRMPGQTAITLELVHRGGEIREVRAVSGTCEHDHLEIDAELRVVSEDGAFDGTQVVTLEAAPPSGSYSDDVVEVTHALELDGAHGTLSPESFEFPAALTFRGVTLYASFRDRAVEGSLVVSVSQGEQSVELDVAAELGAVVEVADPACGIFGTAPTCVLAGCTSLVGRPIRGEGMPACSCDVEQPYCFASAPPGEALPSLYARGDGTRIEVVQFDGLANPPPAPWRTCDESRDGARCGCFAPGEACPPP